MKQTVLLLISILFFSFSILAQENFIKHEVDLIDDGYYGDALKLLLKYDSKKISKDDKYSLYFKISECHYFLQNFKQEAIYKKKMYLLYKYDKEFLISLAEAYQRSGNFKQAIKFYNKYKRKGMESSLAINGINSCEFAINQKNNPSTISVAVVPELSSKFYDYSTSFVSKEKNAIILASSRLYPDGYLKSGLFFSRQIDGKWITPIEFDTALNKNADLGVSTIDTIRSVLFFTKCFKCAEKQYTCDIYFSFMKGDLRGKVSSLNIKSDNKHLASHPSFSHNLNVLFFDADIPGSYGGRDIWYIKYDRLSDTWSSPINAGPEVNTKKDELFPHIRDDNTLFFSSDGHLGMGGLDLFKSTMTSTLNWNTPENLKHPLNSEADDFSIVFKDSNHGLFTSNRPGGYGKDDIYSFSLDEIPYISGNTDETDSTYFILSEILSNNTELSCSGSTMENAMNIYPNPNNGVFSLNIKTEKIGEYTLRVFNTSGIIIYSKELHIDINDITIEINLKTQTRGAYYIQLFNKDSVVVCEKMIIE